MFGQGRERGWSLAAIGMLLVSTDSFFIRAADFDVWTISFLFGAASTIALGAVFSLGDNGSIANAIGDRSGTIVTIVALSSATQLAFIGAVNNTAVSNVVVIVAGTPIVRPRWRGQCFASELSGGLRSRSQPRSSASQSWWPGRSARRHSTATSSQCWPSCSCRSR